MKSWNANVRFFSSNCRNAYWYGIYFESFDIYSDEEVRQGLKEYKDWPTYPQLYVNWELIWGLDIMQEMLEAGEFDELKKSIWMED